MGFILKNQIEKQDPSFSRRSAEKAITGFLKEGYDPFKVFEKIQSKDSVYEISRFLYNACMDKALLNLSLRLLQNGKAPAWPFVLKLLEKYNIRLGEKEEKIIFHVWLKKNPSPALFTCKKWADISAEFRLLRSVYMQELEKKSYSKEQDLLEQLKFAQAQNLIEEEEKIIHNLLEIHPKSSYYQNLQRDLIEKKAFLLIEKQKKQVKESKDLYQSAFKQPALKREWQKAIFQFAEQSPKQAKNLSFFLYFCGWTKEALQALSKDIKHTSDYWFFLDWLFESGQYARGIELINQLCQKKDDESDMLALMYLKARMLYALGQKKQAIEHIRPIAKARPDYKSAVYFLDLWLKSP